MILVTGATGNVGAEVLRALTRAGSKPVHWYGTRRKAIFPRRSRWSREISTTQRR